MREITCVVGARPNFMKMAPILDALRTFPEVEPFLLHTGQHYDEEMSRIFFKDLGLPEPDLNLEIGSGSHARQAAQIMMAFEDALLRRSSSLVLVVGDVNSTMACSLVAAKLLIPVAHVEAGLRSRDRSMPEEINRVVTDAVSDLLFATSPDAVDNLRSEGIPSERIHLVGNPMIDTLRRHLPRARARRAHETWNLARSEFGLVTLHRPSNVDRPDRLREIADRLVQVSQTLPIIFPVHPRTRARLGDLSFRPPAGLILIDPLGYLEFLSLLEAARFTLTDSGGIQEETTALGVPCLTLRANTERPITITEGTNRLLGEDVDSIVPAVQEILDGKAPEPRCPELWDGRAGQRMATILSNWLTSRPNL